MAGAEVDAEIAEQHTFQATNVYQSSLHQHSSSLINGTTFGDRFVITRGLGSGSFGHTYLAHDNVRNGPVALKLLDWQGATDWKTHELFEREAKVLRSLRHHSVPEIYDTAEVEWQSRQVPVLIMEFVEGFSLAELIDQKKSHDLAMIMRLMLDLLGVLEYLHERVPPVLHRDIKPANVIVRPNGSPVLVDFGSVRQVFRNADETGSTIAGTYGYMPYEQYMGQATPASDLFSLGATLLHALTGRPPKDFMDGHGKIALPNAVSQSEPLQRVLVRMLRASPQERFASAREARTALLVTPGLGTRTIADPTTGQQAAVLPLTAAPMTSSASATALTTVSPVIPTEVKIPVPRLMDAPQKTLLKRLAPTMFDYMDTTAKSTDESTLLDGFAFVAITLITFGVYPAVFWSIARSRRRRLRRFIRNGVPTFARIHRIDSEETAFRSRIARVHYEFEVNGVLHRDSDQVLPLIAGRWDVNQYIAILYIASVPYDSVIVSES
ncbi:MAG: serine/threonine-protein kinase [Gemmatimonas sp.]